MNVIQLLRQGDVPPFLQRCRELQKDSLGKGELRRAGSLTGADVRHSLVAADLLSVLLDQLQAQSRHQARRRLLMSSLTDLLDLGVLEVSYSGK